MIGATIAADGSAMRVFCSVRTGAAHIMRPSAWPRSRATGDGGAFLHWTKVAAEVARLSPVAEINLATVQAIVDAELDAARPSQTTPP